MMFNSTKFVLEVTEVLNSYNSLEVEIYFTLKVHGNYTTDFNQATEYAICDEAEMMKKLLHLDNFEVKEIYSPEPGTK